MIRFKHLAVLLGVFASLYNGAEEGYAVPIGGALSFGNLPVWQRLVDLAGGRDARFVVIPAAAAHPEKSGTLAAAALRKAGAQATVLPVAPEWPGRPLADAVSDPALIDAVNHAQGVFFVGGAQERIVDSLQPGSAQSPLLQAIWAVYQRGGVIAGTSAGAAIMSTTMFRDPPDPLQVLKGELRDGKEVMPGLGFVGKSLFVDQHFLKRGRVGRMLPLMQAKGYRLGLGVDENTAAIVHGDDIEVIGATGALLVDLGDARSDGTIGAFNIRGARLSFLASGDHYNLHTGVLAPSPAKQA
jgi:cyanophycinase